jgi:hypothetical protein
MGVRATFQCIVFSFVFARERASAVMQLARALFIIIQ